MNNSLVVRQSISIKASPEKIWNVLTDSAFAFIIGNEIDTDLFLESEWKLGSVVYFKYKPDKIVAKGIVAECDLHSVLHVEYNEINYSDTWRIEIKDTDTSILIINSGPYPNDYDEQVVVWNKWLVKVKALSEV